MNSTSRKNPGFLRQDSAHPGKSKHREQGGSYSIIENVMYGLVILRRKGEAGETATSSRWPEVAAVCQRTLQESRLMSILFVLAPTRSLSIWCRCDRGNVMPAEGIFLWWEGNTRAGGARDEPMGIEGALLQRRILGARHKRVVPNYGRFSRSCNAQEVQLATS